MISSERPNREIHQFLEPIVEQLTIVHGKRVELKLEIVPKSPLAGPRQRSRRWSKTPILWCSSKKIGDCHGAVSIWLYRAVQKAAVDTPW